MATVTLKDVRKSYGSAPVLHGVSIDVPDGEFVTLVGPSGCGKSTLLRMVAGLESITGGSVAIGGQTVNSLPPKDRDIAMVFQSYALYPQKTVAENMGYALKLAKLPKPQIMEHVDRAAEILALTPLLDRYPRQLSGGQRQRVAMGRAIVRNPKVFLFDEPLSNLDAKLRVQMRAEIKELHQRLRTTTLYVTHDQVEAMTMADRIVVMNAGIVEQVGSPLELFDRPANTFVATFLGSPSMNLLSSTAATRGSQRVVEVGEGQFLPLSLDSTQAPDGTKLIVGIRPEHVEVRAEPAKDTIALAVMVVEPTGSETTVLAKLGSTTFSVVLRYRAALSAGELLHVRPNPENLHLFDEAGKRIETGR
jgi:multiple sugar transport system ATP-binding protein